MDNSEAKLVRIVPAPAEGNGPHRAQGTKVFVGDLQMTGVTRIELICEVGDVWRARIDCHVQPTDIDALAFVYTPNLWHHIRRWFRG